MDISNIKPAPEDSYSIPEISQSILKPKKIFTSPPLPDKCVSCRALLKNHGSHGMATWPVCASCFERVHHGDLTHYLKKWIEHEHEKERKLI